MIFEGFTSMKMAVELESGTSGSIAKGKKVELRRHQNSGHVGRPTSGSKEQTNSSVR